jgi:hypothetical protein
LHEQTISAYFSSFLESPSETNSADLHCQSKAGSGFKTSPRTQPLRWGKTFNPRNSQLFLRFKSATRLDFGPIEDFETTSRVISAGAGKTRHPQGG